MGSFKHFHEESVNRCVTNQLEEEEMLQALQANGSQRWQSKKELSKPVGGGGGHRLASRDKQSCNDV